METHELLDGEEVISQSNNNLITLTNYRLRYQDSSWGHSLIVSIMLEKISSIQVKYKSRPLFLWVAITAFIAAFYFIFIQKDVEPAGMAGVVGLVTIVIYLASREHKLQIQAHGDPGIEFRTTNMARHKILDFINGLEKAIWERQNDLKKS